MTSLIFFAAVLVADRSGFLSSLRRPPKQADLGAASVHLASFRQDAVPSLEGGVGWINSGPIDLAKLKGKIVLLDFWTYCCINCHHILPDLAKLEEKYKKELVVIGVHSAKFDAEKDTENIRRKVAEYRIKHPVVNDADMVIWRRFGVNSWPTIVLIDPAGGYVGSASGEGHFDKIDEVIGKLAASFKDKLNLRPMEFTPEKVQGEKTGLLYPGKILADVQGKRLFITDTGHNRIVQTDLEGKTSAVIGDGGEGLRDGSFDVARFNRPQGICLDGETLYVADTENHAIRAVDLKAKMVTTIAGNGKQSHRFPLDRYEGRTADSELSSPWDIIQVPGVAGFFIAMAGPHQIWKMDPKAGRIGVFAGSGHENIADGTPESARFAQPSGLATDGTNLYVADSEVSGVRVISGLKTDQPEVGRIVGLGLFDFGDQDGRGAEVRLQHCLGLAYGAGRLFIADTYNNKVKVADPATKTVKTFSGDGTPASSDKPARFYQPGGLSVANGNLYVADTNNHGIRVVEIKSGSVKTLKLEGLAAPKEE